MRYLADMGISIKTVRALRDRGHDIVHLHEENLHRLSDGKILEKARSENRIVLTFDLGFYAILALSGGLCPSVIIFRTSDALADHVTSHIERISEECGPQLAKNTTICVEDDRFRVRALPIQSTIRLPGK